MKKWHFLSKTKPQLEKKNTVHSLCIHLKRRQVLRDSKEVLWTLAGCWVTVDRPWSLHCNSVCLCVCVCCQAIRDLGSSPKYCQSQSRPDQLIFLLMYGTHFACPWKMHPSLIRPLYKQLSLNWVVLAVESLWQERGESKARTLWGSSVVICESSSTVPDSVI